VAALLLSATAFRLRGKECRCDALGDNRYYPVAFCSFPYGQLQVACYNAATLLKKFDVSIIQMFFVK